MRRKRARGGFTLLEMGIVLAGIALIATMGLTMGPSMFQSADRVSTNNKLDTIEQALLAFRLANNRLPCPADATLADTDANAGVEGVSTGACTTGSTYVNGFRTVAASPGPTANAVDTTNHVVEGAVPFRTLSLPQEFQYDGWGRKYAYAVDQRVTAANAMLTQSLNDMCGISVTDAGGVAGNRTRGAIYALAGFGQDGHGGYLKGGVRMNAGSTNTGEQTNCHCNASAVATTYAASYVEKDATANPAASTDVFDDVVRFKERWQMMSFDDPYASGLSAVCNTSTGLRFDDAAADDTGGHSVAVGDVNGDTIPDLIIGAPQTYGGGCYTGSVYVVFGKNGQPWPANPIALLASTVLDGTNGFRIDGEAGCDSFGNGVAVGDVDGDGKADIVVIARLGWSNGLGGSGSVYVIYGGATRRNGAAWAATQVVDPTFLNGGGTAVNGFRLNNAQFDDYHFGDGFAVGDINGDGKADIIIGSYAADPGGVSDAGSVYVIFGKASGWAVSQTFNTAFMNGGGSSLNGFRLGGAAGGYYCGYRVAVGDINGDGKKDILIDCFNVHKAYVIFGEAAGWPASPIILTTGAGTLIDGTKGFRLDGPASMYPMSIASGNVNGDVSGSGYPLDDILWGGNNTANGSAYVIFGKAAGWAATKTVDNTIINGTNGFRIDGEGAGDQFGTQALGVGDVNGDGIQDIIAGSYRANTGDGDAGTSIYVIFGKASGWAATQTANPAFLNGGGAALNGFRLDGDPADDGFGYRVTAGDITGDGKADVIIGAYYASPGGNANAGSVYVAFGKSSGWTTPIDLNTWIH